MSLSKSLLFNHSCMYAKRGGVAAYHIVWIGLCFKRVPGVRVPASAVDSTSRNTVRPAAVLIYNRCAHIAPLIKSHACARDPKFGDAQLRHQSAEGEWAMAGDSCVILATMSQRSVKGQCHRGQGRVITGEGQHRP